MKSTDHEITIEERTKHLLDIMETVLEKAKDDVTSDVFMSLAFTYARVLEIAAAKKMA